MSRENISNLFTPRTFFAAIFYGAFIYLVVTEKELPQELVLTVGMIQGYYFGRKGTNGRNGKKEVRDV